MDWRDLPAYEGGPVMRNPASVTKAGPRRRAAYREGDSRTVYGRSPRCRSSQVPSPPTPMEARQCTGRASRCAADRRNVRG